MFKLITFGWPGTNAFCTASGKKLMQLAHGVEKFIGIAHLITQTKNGDGFAYGRSFGFVDPSGKSGYYYDSNGQLVIEITRGHQEGVEYTYVPPVLSTPVLTGPLEQRVQQSGYLYQFYSNLFPSVNHPPSVAHFVWTEGPSIASRSLQIYGGAGMVAAGTTMCSGGFGIGCALGGAALLAKGADNIQAAYRRENTYAQQGIEAGAFWATGDQEMAKSIGVYGNLAADLGISVYGLGRLVPANNPLGGKYNGDFYANEKYMGSPYWQMAYKDMATVPLYLEIGGDVISVVNAMEAP